MVSLFERVINDGQVLAIGKLMTFFHFLQLFLYAALWLYVLVGPSFELICYLYSSYLYFSEVYLEQICLCLNYLEYEFYTCMNYQEKDITVYCQLEYRIDSI